MPRWLLIILWGVLVLTAVDGGYLVYLSLFFPNESANNVYNNHQQGLVGPVVLTLRSLAIDFLNFVESNDSAITALSTVFIAIFTLTLSLATKGLFAMAERQAEDMRVSLRIAKDSADAAVESTKLARAEFASTHRPRLIVRRIYFKSDSTVAYEVANIGAAGAEILDAKNMVCFDKLPTGDPNVGVSAFIAADYVHAGTYFEFVHGIADDKVIEEFSSRKGYAKVGATKAIKPTYFLGHIAYKDSLGISRRTAFCRVYDFGTERFMPIPNADQDYEHVD